MTVHAPVFPTDIDSIRALGVAAWRDSFEWPIGDRDYDALLDALWAAFDSVHASLGAADADVWLADTVALGTVGQCVHFRAVAALARENGRSVLAKGASRIWLEAGPREAFGAAAGAELQGLRIAAAAKGAAKSWILNKRAGAGRRLRAAAGVERCWALGSRSPLLDAYVAAEGLAPCYVYARQILSALSAVEPSAALQAGVGRVLAAADEFCRRRWGFEAEAQGLASGWLSRLATLAAARAELERRARPPETLLLTDVSRPTHKLIALAFARKGCNTVAFQHGNIVGQLRQKSAAWHAHAHCSAFITYSDAAARLLDRAYRETSVAARRPVAFRGVRGGGWMSSLASAPGKAAAERVRTVMLVGYPMNTIRYQYSAGDFFTFQLHAELRVADVLRDAGFRVVYKAHPQRVRELGDAFMGRVDEIITEPFEQTWHRADAFVFGSMTTTVFPLALATPLPVAILDIDGLAWDAEAEALLKRRVVSVPAWFDERNRLRFNEQALVAGLAGPPTRPNDDFVRTYLYGDPPADRPAAARAGVEAA